MKSYRRQPQFAVEHRNRRVHSRPVADWFRTLFDAVETHRNKPAVEIGTSSGIRFMRITA